MLSDFAEVLEAGSQDEVLLRLVAWDRLPRHVGIIMDGNGRWAAQRGQPRVAGHRAGVEAVRASVDTAARLGLGALTLYAFSTENWKRPRYEVDALMRMLKRYLRLELEEIHRQNIRFQTIGRTGELAQSVRREIDRAAERTAVTELRAAGRDPVDITEADIERGLYTSALPELDLLLRTSGEMRISNFLLWQAAYSEIYVTETLWPDFRRPHLLEAVVEFQRRDRRFGGLQLVASAK